MSSVTKPFSLFMALAVGATLACTAQAAWWNPVSWFGKDRPKRVQTLVVTGNFIKSRILAELIQYETSQPILLLPSGNESDTMFFLASNKETFPVKEKDFARFVKYLQPKRVLFLGNETYAPERFKEELRDKIPLWSVSNDDWSQIAASVGEVLKLRHLGFDYLVLLNQLDAEGKLKPPNTEAVFGGYVADPSYWDPARAEQNE